MTLIRWNNPMAVSRLFDEMFNEGFGREAGYTWKPLANVSEKEDRFELDLAVPGMKKDDFNISIEKNMLSISAETKTEQTDERKEDHVNYTRKEFTYGSFCRSFTLPESVDREKISAEYSDGILHLVLPKSEKETLRKMVKIS
ncbi:MAG TPA: Hsp20/alpha crystallin family protein [Bacteroidales bacterium]|nr:Hsp20/alpha crystallin family protein [Bacteroidales bacterium]HRZ76238.1 Hsp20/alpha crystallin family protein [Bacteroidales bacterium]